MKDEFLCLDGYKSEIGEMIGKNGCDKIEVKFKEINVNEFNENKLVLR